MADLLPEQSSYRDEGCELFPSCLKCPLPRCRYDEQGAKRQVVKGLRNQEIVRLHRLGNTSISELAGIFGLNKRTVHRILRRVSDE